MFRPIFIKRFRLGGSTDCDPILVKKLGFALKQSQTFFMMGKPREGRNWLQTFQHQVEQYRSKPQPTACSTLLMRIDVPLEWLQVNAIVPADKGLAYIKSTLAFLEPGLTAGYFKRYN
jgi:hypothetical protein